MGPFSPGCKHESPLPLFFTKISCAQLNDYLQTLIRALVDVTRNSVTSTKIISDVISGKGGGLVGYIFI